MEEVRLPIGKVGASEDEVYYMFQNNENEILFYVLNKGVYSLNLRDLSISKEMMDMFPRMHRYGLWRKMYREISGLVEDELSCYNPKTKNLAVLFRQIKMETRVFMLTQDLLAYDSSMLVGGRTSEWVWSFSLSSQ